MGTQEVGRIVGMRHWASSLFAGWRVTLESAPVDYDLVDNLSVPGAFVADVQNMPGGTVEVLLVEESGADELSETSIRQYLPSAFARAFETPSDTLGEKA